MITTGTPGIGNFTAKLTFLVPGNPGYLVGGFKWFQLHLSSIEMG
jgi:hypothetical protein